MTETVLRHCHQGILTLTLNRPKVRNAMSLEMVGVLREALAQAQEDPKVRVLVLRGAQGHFCAGGDLKDMAQARATPVTEIDPIQELNAAFGYLTLEYARASLPVIAVVEGTVMGGGFGLACIADVVIASTTADFRLPETSLGVIPAQIAPFLVLRLGFSEAKRLALTGARLDAAAAKACGLVHEVCSPEAVDRVLREQIQRFISCAPEATARTKALMFELFWKVEGPQIERAATLFAEAVRGPESMEGVSAFLSRRKPAWWFDANGEES